SGTISSSNASSIRANVAGKSSCSNNAITISSTSCDCLSFVYKEWTKAIDYAEDFISLYTKDKQSQLVELIVMALFEQEDFPATLARIEEALEEEIVPEVQQRLEMIRVLCSEQNAIRSTTLLHEMEMLVKQEEHIELFYIMKDWKRLNIQPPDLFNDFLKNSFVHPVIKTFILEELQDNNISATVEVEKFGNIIEVVPNQIEK